MPLLGRKSGRRKSADQSPAAAPAPAEAILADAPVPGPDGLRSVADHRDYLLAHVEELPYFGQNLLDALGLSVCEDIVSDVDLPGFDNSAMDGYAVRAEDVADASPDHPLLLAVVDEVAAGGWRSEPLPPGTAIKVMTGAVVPEGADAVVPYEHTDRGDDEVVIHQPTQPGRHIRLRGEDVAADDVVLRHGERLGPRSAGLLAAIGVDRVLVRPRPRLVVIATGSELIEPGRPLGDPGMLYDSNSYLLAAAAKADGAQVFRVGMVGDDERQIRDAISDQLLRADLILTTGGVSQGDYDLVKQVLPELGATDFCEVAMQPGKPQGFGLIGEDRVPMIMMPGNPVSAFVSYQVFVRPVLRKMMGIQPPVEPLSRAVSTHLIRSLHGRAQYLRGVVVTDPAGVRTVSTIGGPGSHLVKGLARANCLVVVPAETEVIPAGQPVEVLLLDGDR